MLLTAEPEQMEVELVVGDGKFGLVWVRDREVEVECESVFVMNGGSERGVYRKKCQEM